MSVQTFHQDAQSAFLCLVNGLPVKTLTLELRLCRVRTVINK